MDKLPSGEIVGNPDLDVLVRAVLAGYILDPRGIHGPAHWARVLENGLRLAETTGADRRIVRLFAIFHDSRRENEGTDEGHGRRGAGLAESLRNGLFSLPDRDFDTLIYACEKHTDVILSEDITVQTCWDADRLDLPRVWKKVDPAFLGTAAARDPGLIRWAGERSRNGIVPRFVGTDWDPGS
ncbi:MAG: hypothetical protein ABSA30_04940 [Candidatus Aminicenantales bacterium]|jgi:uncharacterized protein